jgi:pimeloyl-ACP methyl ester carboxylesterase
LVRDLSTGELADLPEVVIRPGLGAPDYVEPWAREMGRDAGDGARPARLASGWRKGITVHGARGRRRAAGWLTETDRRDLVLIGHSSGAQSAILAALAVPDRLAGVVLAGPTLEPGARIDRRTAPPGARPRPAARSGPGHR